MDLTTLQGKLATARSQLVANEMLLKAIDQQLRKMEQAGLQPSRKFYEEACANHSRATLHCNQLLQRFPSAFHDGLPN